MHGLQVVRSGVAGAGALALLLGLAGCSAGVKQEELSQDLQQLREELRGEIRTGDEQNARRIATLEDRLASLNRELQALQRDFDARIEQLEAKLVVDVPVHFAFDSHEIAPGERPVLDRFAAIVKEHYGDAVITIEGFADPAGSAAYNKWLGEKRAAAVRQYLVENHGVDGGKLKVVSYGEATERQVAPGQHGPGETGRENRRVAFVLDYAGEDMQSVARGTASANR